MRKSQQLLACLVLLIVILTPSLNVALALPPLAAGTFPTGTLIVPMDDKQADRIRVYGFIHEFLRTRSDAELARVIEPPDVTMQTSLTPSGAVYQGGPFLIDQRFLANVNSLLSTPDFNKVTVTKLTAAFTSNRIFFVRQPTTILVIKGVFGRTDITLNAMRINYTIIDPSTVEKNPSIINRYSLVVVDCPGWYGNPTSYSANRRAKIETIYETIKSHVQAGNEVIFTDIALRDLNATFPGYVQLAPGGSGSWPATVYNPPNPAGTFAAEFPSQYYNAGPNPNSVNIVTEGGGWVVSGVDSARKSDVRILMDTTKFGVPFRYAILGFYFEFGSGIVEGLALHPQQQTPVGSKGFYAVAQIYGNKFVHGPQIDFFLSASPTQVTIQQGQVANYTVTVTSVGSFSAPVNLQVSGFPANSTTSFSPPAVTPTAGGSSNSLLRVATNFNTPNGTYSLTITGTSTLPAITRRINVTLIVTLARPDFVIRASPRDITVNLTKCGNVSVSVQPIGTFNNPVNLSLSGLPQHISYKYSPQIVTPPVGVTVFSTLTLCPAADATPGNYTLTVIGTSILPSGTIVHTDTVMLRVPKPVGPNWLIYLLVLLLLLLALGLALLALYLSRKRVRRIVAFPVGPVRPVRRPRVQYVLPIPTVRCRYCGRIMPLHAVYCPHCGRPQVVLVRPPPRMLAPPGVARVERRGILAFVLSLIAGILVILNSAALLATGFWGPPTNWSGIFFWLPSIGQSYAFALGTIIGLVLIMGSLVSILRHGVLADIIIFPFAIFSLIVGGGFIAGMVLGIVGGILGALRR